MRAVVVAMLALALACGAAPPPPASLSPATDRDPEPWVPTPTSEAPAGADGETVSLSVAGGDAQARLIALRLVTAVRDGDEAALMTLLEDPLARAQPRPSAARLGRAQVIAMLLHSPRRSEVAAQATLEELVEIDRIEVMPLSELLPTAPEGLQSTDWVVYLPLTTIGVRSFRFLISGWQIRGAVIVRDAGSGPRVVGL